MILRKATLAVALTILLVGVMPARAQDEAAIEQVVTAAHEQLDQTLYYDPSYQRLAYPGGDVPLDRGVCTDVVIRAFRKANVDLQVRVHQDMKAAFSAYPQHWGLSRPDPNIDHRRVPNLMTFFERKDKALLLSHDPAGFLPGDVVAWRLPGGRLHIGIVSTIRTTDARRYLLVHNIGAGAKLEDILFAYEIIGHYRYF